MRKLWVLVVIFLVSFSWPALAKENDEKGKIKFLISEPGADVYLVKKNKNQVRPILKPVGVSPSNIKSGLTVEVVSGLRKFFIDKPGFQPWERQVDVLPGTTRVVIVNLIARPRPKGELELDISEPEVRIYIDDSLAAETGYNDKRPSFRLVYDSLYPVRVEKDGFRVWKRLLLIPTGQAVRRVEVVLKPVKKQ